MKRIAYLTGRTWRGKAMTDHALPEREAADFKLIAEAGAAHQLVFEPRYWDEPELPLAGYDAAIVRSCWDYIERYDEFIAATAAHERAGLKLYNPAHALRWNARKTYLQELGALAIPTVWIEHVTALEVTRAFETLDASELVIKPQVSAGSRNTLRLKRNSWSEADLIGAPRGAAMAQGYLPSIETEGERSLFWFGGVFSHAVRKVPAAGAWLANRLEHARVFAEAPPAEARDVAEHARAKAPQDLLYVRIDLVRGDDARWRVIEIEAIEPYLFLAFAPEGAAVFTGGLAGVLAG